NTETHASKNPTPLSTHCTEIEFENLFSNLSLTLFKTVADTFVFHDLRHTQASLLLAAGVDLKVIQKRLGHRDFATTANTYSHLLQNAQNDAVDKLSGLMKKHASSKSDREASSSEAGEYTE
ncbi:MAG: tyrosine-type recombinase/integrase, partial [Planctomycetales bacterium]|nr:tyrosine-type recombinase/integrase [Planctomycetales bacterium]